MKKKCPKCNRELETTHFYKDKYNKTGFCVYCKECQVLIGREKSLRLKDKYRNKAKRYYDSNKEKVLAKRREYYLKNKHKKKAHYLVHKECINNDKFRKYFCEECGSLGTDAHHEDYNKPLDVIWLCRKCHLLKHPIDKNKNKC